MKQDIRQDRILQRCPQARVIRLTEKGQGKIRQKRLKTCSACKRSSAGDVDFYNSHYYNVYCDLDTLKPMLKKEFSGRAIPGQPVTNPESHIKSSVIHRRR